MDRIEQMVESETRRLIVSLNDILKYDSEQRANYSGYVMSLFEQTQMRTAVLLTFGACGWLVDC